MLLLVVLFEFAYGCVYHLNIDYVLLGILFNLSAWGFRFRNTNDVLLVLIRTVFWSIDASLAHRWSSCLSYSSVSTGGVSRSGKRDLGIHWYVGFLELSEILKVSSGEYYPFYYRSTVSFSKTKNTTAKKKKKHTSNPTPKTWNNFWCSSYITHLTIPSATSSLVGAHCC